MPTSSSAGMTWNAARQLLGSMGYIQESLSGNRTRWTYRATRCGDGVSWCLSTSLEGFTPYSLTFNNTASGSLTSGTSWVLLTVGMRNASTLVKTCGVREDHSYEGEQQFNTLAYTWGGAPGTSRTQSMWMWPGTAVTLTGYCQDPEDNPQTPGIDGYVQRVQVVTTTSPITTWNATFSVGPAGPVME